MVFISISRRVAPVAALILWCAAGARAAAPAAPSAFVTAARPNPIARITLSAPREKLMAGESMTLQFAAFDAADQPIVNPRLSFRVTPPFVAKVTGRGVLTARKAGTATIVAVSGKVTSDPISLTVNEVGRIDIAPAGVVAVYAGDTLVFHAQAYDLSGAPVPNADYPTVPIVWKSSGGRTAPITQAGGLRTTRPGATIVSASVGRVRSENVRVAIARRELGRSTRLFLTGEPVNGLRSLFVTIDRIEVATHEGVWQTMATRSDIDALVGQPIDVLALVNRRIQIGTGILPEGNYERIRITMSTDEGANYGVRLDNGARVDLPFQEPEDAVLDTPFYVWVATGYPLNVVLDFRSATSLTPASDTTATYLKPDWDGVVMDDTDLAHPFGALVGQLANATSGDVFLTNVDDGGTITNYFGQLDPNTGVFRIGQVPTGRYELHVIVPGHAEMTLPQQITIAPGRDTILSQPIVVP
jgi:Domain of unknown function (DUF4382)